MEQLLDNFRRFRKSADIVYATGDYTSAAILYFKAMFALLDYILLIERGSTPKDHSERFRLLEQEFPGLYSALDKNFPTYRDTYMLSVSKDKCDKVKKDVEKIAKEYQIPLSN